MLLLFFRILYRIASVDSLLKEGKLLGSVSSGGARTYIPDIYAKTQKDWVENFYKQNSYLEYEALARIGISDPKGYIKKRFTDLIFLRTCCVSNTFLYQVDPLIEEAIAGETWTDLMPLLPPVLDETDIKELVERCMEGNKSLEASKLLCDTIIVSDAFMTSLAAPFEDLMLKKAQADLKEGAIFAAFAAQKIEEDKSLAEEEEKRGMSKKEERKQKGTTAKKHGGGVQGREIKMKATKKKYNPRGGKGGGKDDSDDEAESSASNRGGAARLVFMSVGEIEKTLKSTTKSFRDASDELIETIAQQLHGPLSSRYLEIAKALFLANITERRKKAEEEKKKKLAEEAEAAAAAEATEVEALIAGEAAATTVPELDAKKSGTTESAVATSAPSSSSSS